MGRKSDEEMVHLLARRMAEQMVAASVGPGPAEIARRKAEEQSLANLMKKSQPDDSEAQPISSVLTRGSSLTVQQHEEAMEDDGEASDEEEKAHVISDTQETPEVFKATDKAFHVNEITEPIPKDDRGNAILSIVNELISNDGNVLNASGEYLYHKCLIRFAVKVGIDALRDRKIFFPQLSSSCFSNSQTERSANAMQKIVWCKWRISAVFLAKGVRH